MLVMLMASASHSVDSIVLHFLNAFVRLFC